MVLHFADGGVRVSVLDVLFEANPALDPADRKARNRMSVLLLQQVRKWGGTALSTRVINSHVTPVATAAELDDVLRRIAASRAEYMPAVRDYLASAAYARLKARFARPDADAAAAVQVRHLVSCAPFLPRDTAVLHTAPASSDRGEEVLVVTDRFGVCAVHAGECAAARRGLPAVLTVVPAPAPPPAPAARCIRSLLPAPAPAAAAAAAAASAPTDDVARWQLLRGLYADLESICGLRKGAESTARAVPVKLAQLAGCDFSALVTRARNSTPPGCALPRPSRRRRRLPRPAATPMRCRDISSFFTAAGEEEEEEEKEEENSARASAQRERMHTSPASTGGDLPKKRKRTHEGN